MSKQSGTRSKNLYNNFSDSNICHFLDFSTVFKKMASDPKRPKLAEDFTPSLTISEVLDVIKEKYFGPVNIDEHLFG